MKVLIISDDNELVTKTDSFFKKSGFDTIKYKWLLKALDNIEEIEPDVIILSSSEYPRHWKTLVQFAKSGIVGAKVDVYLYESVPLSQEELEKAKALGISGYFDKLDSEELNKTFSVYLQKEQSELSNEFSSDDFETNNDEIIQEVENIPVENEYSDNSENPDDYEEDEVPTVDSIIMENSKPAQILLTNPVTHGLVCGSVISNINNRIEVKLDVDMEGISNNDLIPHVTYFDNEMCYSFSSEIFILNEIEKTVILTVQDQYEKI